MDSCAVSLRLDFGAQRIFFFLHETFDMSNVTVVDTVT